MYLFSAPNKNLKKLKVGPYGKLPADSKNMFTVLVLQTGAELLRVLSRIARRNEALFKTSQIRHARDLMKKNEMHIYRPQKLSSFWDRWRWSVL